MPDHKRNNALRWIGGIFAGPVLLVAYATWTGRAFIVATLLLGAAGFRSQSNPVILSACILAAVLVAAGAASYAVIAGLGYECRFLREETSCGEKATLVVSVVNRNLLPAGFLWITVSGGGRLAPRKISRPVPYIGPGKTVELRIDFTAKGRGRVPRVELRARSIFPTGLFQTGFSETVPVYLLVLPRIGRLGPRLKSYLSESSESRVYSPAFLSGETRSLREYRPGDNLRRVHWRVSAHRRRLVVREFEEPLGTEVSLLLDPYTPPLQKDDFEWVVSLAATLAARARERNLKVRITIGGPKPVNLLCEDPLGVHEALRRLALLKGRRRSYAVDLMQFAEPLPREGVVWLAGVAPEVNAGERVAGISPARDSDLLVFQPDFAEETPGGYNKASLKYEAAPGQRGTD